jgi:ribosomal protein L7/L12
MPKMNNKRRREPLILAILEEAFELARKDKGMAHPFPYDTSTNTIRLPANLERELRGLIQAGNKIEAVKRVTRLTGAGLRVSKDYVDSLVDFQRPSKRKRA